MAQYVRNLHSSRGPVYWATYTPNVPVCCWQPTAPMFLYAVGNLQPSWPCMLATYSPRGPVCWQPTALMALYVGNPQPSWPCMLATYSPHGPVCSQPTLLSWPCILGNLHPQCSCMLLATYSPNVPVCCWQPTALVALYVGNLQPSWPCMLATHSPRGPVCWQRTALVALYVGRRRNSGTFCWKLPGKWGSEKDERPPHSGPALGPCWARVASVSPWPWGPCEVRASFGPWLVLSRPANVDWKKSGKGGGRPPPKQNDYTCPVQCCRLKMVLRVYMP